MQKKTYRWRLFKDTNSAVERYCSHCGKKAFFSDTGKTRQNANGKNLYEYAIYKCEKDHTWNRLIRTYKAAEQAETFSAQEEGIFLCESSDNIVLAEAGSDEIEIILEEVTGKWRIDKLLSEKITDISRNAVCKMIEAGVILVDGMVVKHNLNLKKHQVITILPEIESCPAKPEA